MKKQATGKIIFTSSGVGVMGFYNISPYASSKGAIESLAKCLKVELEDYNISLHFIHPPLCRTTSAKLLPVPEEMKKEPSKVGYGLAKRIIKTKPLHHLPQIFSKSTDYILLLVPAENGPFHVFYDKKVSKNSERKVHSEMSIRNIMLESVLIKAVDSSRRFGGVETYSAVD